MRIGLVFAGGGGKGAYQIGVWKALEEFGLTSYIKAISGTSVGALNAALWASGSVLKAEHLWKDISPEKILKINMNPMIAGAASILPSSWFSAFIKLSRQLAGYGYFSREGLESLIRKIDLSLIKVSPVSCFSTCFNVSALKADYFLLNDFNEREIESILLASSALPGIFGSVEVNGVEYLDGGLVDNVPVAPVYQLGCDLIVIVHLSRTSQVKTEDFPDSTILEIVPQEDQGNLFTGTLDFTAAGSSLRIEQGYQDAKRILEPFWHSFLIQARFVKGMYGLREEESLFKREHSRILEDRKVLKSQLMEVMNDN